MPRRYGVATSRRCNTPSDELLRQIRTLMGCRIAGAVRRDPRHVKTHRSESPVRVAHPSDLKDRAVQNDE